MVSLKYPLHKRLKSLERLVRSVPATPNANGILWGKIK